MTARAPGGAGAEGLKLHPTLQASTPATTASCRSSTRPPSSGLTLLTHAGTSGLGAGEPGGQGLRIDLARPILLDRIAARHPHMKIVLAHVGWPWHLEAVAMALHKSNVYLDISGWKYRYLPDEVKREIPRRLRNSSASAPTIRCSTRKRASTSSTASNSRPTSPRPSCTTTPRRCWPVINEAAHPRTHAGARRPGDIAGAIGVRRLEHSPAGLSASPPSARRRLLDELRGPAPPPLGARPRWRQDGSRAAEGAGPREDQGGSLAHEHTALRARPSRQHLRARCRTANAASWSSAGPAGSRAQWGGG